jgi:4-aminobutyrate aminotransferase
LKVIEREGLLARAEAAGERVMAALREMQERHPSIGEVRGRGFMIGVEFVQDRQTKERAVTLRNAIIQNAFEEGLLLIPCGRNAIRLTPALNVPDAILDEGLQIFEKALSQAEQTHFKSLRVFGNP